MTYPKVAIGDIAANVRRSRQRTLGREGERLIVEIGVSASVPFLVKVIHECLVEAEQTRPVVDEWHGRDVVRNDIVRDGRVVDHDRVNVVVRGIGCIVHSIGNVRDAV